MKNTFFSVLIALLVLPAFTPWMPHGAVHVLHDLQESYHHNRNTSDKVAHGHEHVAHDHDIQTQASNHHAINLDAVTYFSEYLHVDLQSPDRIILTASAQDSQDSDFAFTATLSPQHRYELTSVQSRAPPDWRRHRPDKTPLYLSTQRFRI